MSKRKLKVGDMVYAIMPNGEIERGIIIKKDGRLWLDDCNGNVHALDGGFLDGTTFKTEIVGQMDFPTLVTEFPPITEAELDEVMKDKSKDWLTGFMFGYTVASQDRYQEHINCCKQCKGEMGNE